MFLKQKIDYTLFLVEQRGIRKKNHLAQKIKKVRNKLILFTRLIQRKRKIRARDDENCAHETSEIPCISVEKLFITDASPTRRHKN